MKNTHTLLASALCLSVVASSQAMASNVTLRFAHWLPAHHALPAEGFKEWTESITEASNGTITFDMYPAQQLGSAPDHYDMAVNGIADVTWVNPGYTPGRFPISDMAQLPFIVSNTIRGSKAFTEMYKEYYQEEMDGIYMCVIHGHYPGTLHSKERISHPDQLEGMTIRPANSTIAQYIRHAGASSVQVSAPETREALARGTADAITFPSGSLTLFGVDEITDYHIDYPMYSSWQAILINRGTYDRMTSDQQTVIDNHCTGEWASRVTRGWDDFEREGHEAFRESPDHTMVELTDEELQAWREVAEPLYEDWADSVREAGHDPDALLAELRERLKAVDALAE